MSPSPSESRPSSSGLALLSALVLLASTAACSGGGDSSQAASVAGSSSAAGSGDARPDVVVIVLDSLRADALERSVEGNAVMPRLASWSREQVLFRDATAPSPSTPTSVSAFMSSVPHPAYDGGFDRGTSPSLPVLPELLGDAGYATYGISANHNCSRDLFHDRGFDRFVEAFVEPGLATGPPVRSDYPAHIVPPDAAFGDARRWLEEAGDAPVFAYVHVFQPHAPYDPPDEYLARYERTGHVPLPSLELSDLARLNRTGRFEEEWSAPLRARYDAHCSYVDEHVGEFLDWLSSDRRYRRAAVVVTSDHGEAFMEHGQILHNTNLHEEMVRIPLVVRPPGDGGEGRVVVHPVSLIDVAPTIVRLAGLAPPSSFMGSDLLDGSNRSWPILTSTVANFGQHALRQERWKLMRSGVGRRAVNRLFHLDADPSEKNDLAESEPARLDEMSRELDRILTELESRELEEAPGVSFNEKKLKILESLGYAGATSH